MSIFVSIKPPDETLCYLENCIASLSHLNKRIGIRWYDRSLLHSTVLFLGEVGEGELSFIKKTLEDSVSKLSTFYLDISAPEILFKKERPSIIYMKVFDQSGMLQELHETLLKIFEKKIAIESRPFNPHLTLGKVKGAIHKRKKINIKTGHIDVVFPVTTIELVESVLTPIGPLYTTLYTATIPNAETI